MASAPTRSLCGIFNCYTVNNVIVAILAKSFRDGISALRWMDREIMIALIHQAIDAIDRFDNMLVIVSEELFAERSVYVVGGIDGDLISLVTLFKRYGMPPQSCYIFLGDYLDCFEPSRIDALLLLLSLKLRYPRHVCLFRGHHETYEMCKAIGFDEALEDERLFHSFFLLFNYLPIIGVFGHFLCLHAGVSPFMSDYLFLEQFSKPIEAKRMNARERSTLTDILYGMPDKDLLVQFAPLNTYPIGFRFNLAGLREALETFDCKTLIRGCGHRDSNGADFDFDEDSCISVVSGRSIVYTNHERFLVQIYHTGKFHVRNIHGRRIWGLHNKNSFEKSVNAFINNCGYELRSTPCNFLFDLPNGCAACEWIGQEKKPENVTISHALLKSFTEGMMYPFKLHSNFLFDPRLEQYMYVELFPLCEDFYFYKYDQIAIPFTFVDGHPFTKRPMFEWNERMSQTIFLFYDSEEAGKSKKKQTEHKSYAYIDRIIRPGYDLKRTEKRDLQHSRQLRNWLHSIFAPRLSYKYLVERLSDDSE